MPIEIVRLSPDDWEKLRELRLQAVKDEPLAFGRTYEEEFQKPEADWRRQISDSSYFCAKEGDHFVGMLSTVREKGQKSEHMARIFGVYVAPESRGKGIGRKLMDAALDELQANSAILKIRLNVAVTQEAAYSLYEKMGFKKVGFLEKELFVDGTYTDVILMEKFLH